MISFFTNICMVQILLVSIIHITYSQSSLCVWNSYNQVILNGKYTNNGSATYNGQLYWQLDPVPSNCSISNSYIVYDSTSNWTITTNQTETGLTYCTSSIIHTPTSCNGNWSGYSALNVFPGQCPTLPCNQIEIINTDDSVGQCTGVYYVDTLTGDNVYYGESIHGRHVYLWFNINTFKWYCSKEYQNVCNPNDIILESKHPGWFNISSGDTYQWSTIEHENGISFICDYSSTNTTSTSSQPVVTYSTDAQGGDGDNKTAITTSSDATTTITTSVDESTTTSIDASVTTSIGQATITSVGGSTTQRFTTMQTISTSVMETLAFFTTNNEAFTDDNLFGFTIWEIAMLVLVGLLICITIIGSIWYCCVRRNESEALEKRIASIMELQKKKVASVNNKLLQKV